MKFNKLALAAAVASLPVSAVAMEPMEDEALSGVTGQDGISINIDDGGGMTMDVFIHDNDGIADNNSGDFTYSGYGSAGAIIQDGLVVNAGSAGMDINIDAGSTATTGGTAMLNIGVNFPDGVDIQTGVVRVGNSERDDGTPAWQVEGTTSTAEQVMSNATISLGSGTSLNIQLANEAQGNMIALESTISNGLSVSSLSLDDANSGGSLGASNLTVVDNGGSDLTLDVGVDVTSDGLAIDTSKQGSVDLQITDAYMGDTAAGNTVGDVGVIGLDLSSTTVTVSGK